MKKSLVAGVLVGVAEIVVVDEVVVVVLDALVGELRGVDPDRVLPSVSELVAFEIVLDVALDVGGAFVAELAVEVVVVVVVVVGAGAGAAA